MDLTPQLKPCRVCLVAMQSSESREGVTFRCENCGITIVYGSSGAASTDPDAVDVAQIFAMQNPRS